MHGKPAGWQPQTEDETTCWRVLLVSVILQAVDDLDRQPDQQHAVDPQGARLWLLQDAPALLAALGLEDYSDRLLALVNGKPEPDVWQLPLFQEVL